MNSQKITRLLFIESNLVASAETEMRLLDIGGKLLASHFIDKNNGIINGMHVDGEHLFIVTSQKHMVVFNKQGDCYCVHFKKYCKLSWFPMFVVEKGEH